MPLRPFSDGSPTGAKSLVPNANSATVSVPGTPVITSSSRRASAPPSMARYLPSSTCQVIGFSTCRGMPMPSMLPSITMVPLVWSSTAA